MLTSSLLVVGGVGIGVALYNRRGLLANKTRASLSTLSSVIDTIVPSAVTSTNQGRATDQSGAIDLNIDQAIGQLATKKPTFDKQLTRLISEIDSLALQSHHRPFAELDIDNREALLNTMLNPSGQIVARRNLRMLRDTVLDMFFSRHEGHRLVGYTLPADYSHY